MYTFLNRWTDKSLSVTFGQDIMWRALDRLNEVRPRSARFYVLVFLLFCLKEEKSHFFLAKDTRLVSEEKKKKKIYPSHSGNFCDSVISGIVANDSTKRERLRKESVCLSTL